MGNMFPKIHPSSLVTAAGLSSVNDPILTSSTQGGVTVEKNEQSANNVKKANELGKKRGI